MPKRKSKASGPPHVRVYKWEMDCDAWQSLSADARALLIEFRSLWNVDNRVFLSIRQMGQRLNMCPKRAQKARDELLGRGWIRMMERGSFTRKVRHATVYALTNEPLHPGQPAPKDFMQFSTVVKTTTDGSQNDHRGAKPDPDRPGVGRRIDHRDRPFSPSHGSQNDHTVTVTTIEGKSRVQ
jgi:hypothetical protein